MKMVHRVLGLVLACAAIGASYRSSAVTLDATLFQSNAALKVAGYKGASELVDFPVLVRLREGFPTGFAYADAGTDGAGVRFADADGNLLAHEIDTWNPQGESTVWVKLPSLTNGTVVRVYWKAGEATLPEVTASDVWTRYVAVLHGSDYTNASDSGLACSAGGTTSADATSKVGGAAYGIAQNTMGIQIANPVKNGKITTAEGVTVSGWFRPTKLDASSYNIVIAASEPTWNKGGFLALWVQCYYFSVAVGGTHQGVGGTSARVVQPNVWEHIAFSYAGTKLAIYEDGSAVYSNGSAKQFIDAGQDIWTVGSYITQTVDSFIGQMDEIRLYNGEASADWIKAEHDTATDPMFLIKDEIVPGGAFGATAYLQAVGYLEGETLSGFPLAVRLSAGFPNGFAYADVADPASDIRFFDMDGNLLPHEVDTWNPEGESLVWVRMTTMPTGGSLFKMGWKPNAQIPLVANTPSDVWARYVAVLHGNDYTNASDSGLACSAGGTTSADATSKVGGAAYGIAQNTMGIQIANPVKNGKLTVNGGVTVSGWFRPTKLDASSYNIVIAASEPTWNKGGFLALWERCYYFSVAVGGTHQGVGGTSARVVQPNVWEHIAFSYAGTKLAIYEDGSAVYSNGSAKQFIDAGQDIWTVGSYITQTVDSFIGQMDEIRLYNGEASADWIKAECDSATIENYVVEIDSSTVVRATWTNVGENGNVSDPANWICYNSFGDVVANALPSSESTTAQVAGETSFSIAAGCTPIWKNILLSNVVLTNVCDWSAMGSNYRLAGPLDLNGHDLRVTGYPATGTITDAKGGASFILDVPDGTVVGNGAAQLTGALKFVKEGVGTFRPSATTQSYTGGTEIRAGIAENIATAGVAAYGPAMSTIKVCEGASFDWKGARGTAYSLDLAGHGVEGKGTVYNSVLDTASNYYQIDRVANITLSDDATMDSSGGLFGPMYVNSNPALHEIHLNGHTLTMTSSSTGWRYRFFIRGIKTVGTGTIFVKNVGGVFYGPASDLSSATLEIASLAIDKMSFEISPVVGTFIDHRLACSSDNENVHNTVYVGSRLVPYANAPMENFCLGTDTAKDVTLDLSLLEEPLKTTRESPARSLTFAAGTTITVDPGTRLPPFGSKSMQLVAWSEAPADVTFKLPSELGRRAYRLDVRDTGLYMSCDGMLIIVR